MEKSKTELILVYNAESGFFNSIRDTLHKTISPSTYQCNLCALTFGTINMKSKWKRFIDKLKIPSTFLHRDEFFKMLKTHHHKIIHTSFPAIFFHNEGKVQLLIKSTEINKCKTLDELMELVDKKLLNV
jgi:hypothetical protein